MGRTSDAKERLMEAATDLMWEESFGAVTIDDICKRANVKKGSFYYFFESKSDLSVAAIEWLWETDMKPRLDARFSSSIEPLERLRAYLEGVYTFHAESAKKTGQVIGCPLCSLGSEVCTQEPKLTAAIRELFARKRRYYESTIRDAMAEGAIEPGDAAQKAMALFALIDGTTTQARIMNNPELLRMLPEMGIALLQPRRRANSGPAPATVAAS